ncbi:MAG TPA: hypothetical protein VGL53_11035, partial [Bryobacteraceae bacterium]
MTHEPIERDAVQVQLERMLASPLFRNSKRYPCFLRFVVEHSLAGERDALKERVLGVRVFGREPDYDTNEDPVVRVTAGEVRKRIAQYYHEPSHQTELRIDLPPGSYVAEFHTAPPDVLFLSLSETTPTGSAPEPAALETAPLAAPASKTIRPWIWTAVGFAAATAIASAIWFYPAQRTVVDRFWAPVIGQDKNVVICIGQRNFVAQMDAATRRNFHQTPLAGSEEPAPGTDISLAQLYYMGSQNIALVDSVALARIAALLRAKGREVQIRGEHLINLEDLRRQPAVLIGGFSNDWSMLLTGPLRFRFRLEGSRWDVEDSRNPSDYSRSLSSDLSYLRVEDDYAVVTRERDPNTDRVILVFGGITGFGTQAAGEFLTNPAYMSAFLDRAPADWERKNIQIVLGT